MRSSNSAIGYMTIRPTRVSGGLFFERSSFHSRRVATLTPMYSAASHSLTYCFRTVRGGGGTDDWETTNSAILVAIAGGWLKRVKQSAQSRSDRKNMR